VDDYVRKDGTSKGQDTDNYPDSSTIECEFFVHTANFAFDLIELGVHPLHLGKNVDLVFFPAVAHYFDFRVFLRFCPAMAALLSGQTLVIFILLLRLWGMINHRNCTKKIRRRRFSASSVLHRPRH